MIYILEDDDSIWKLIGYSLKNHGYDVKGFSLPSQFFEAMGEELPKLVLLDIMLPEEDGVSILKKIRSDVNASTLPVIMLTAKDSEFDIVTALDSGADDYVTKPFGMMTLLSRIKAVLRRYEKSDFVELKIECGGIEIDENKHTVLVGGKPVFLTVKEFDLLCLLMRNRGNVLSRERLMKSIWGISANVESRTIDVHVRTLRQKLGSYEKNIATIRGVGYKFV